MELFLNPHDELISHKETKPSKSKFNPLPETTNFVIATAVSEAYLDRVLNLIGSIHFYEPNIKIVVYDIGLSLNQAKQLICLKNVELVPFISALETFPLTFSKDIDSYSWKSFVISHAYTVHSNFIYVDSGTEIWQSLNNTFSEFVPSLYNLFSEQCYLFFTQETDSSLIHPNSMKWMKEQFREEFDSQEILSKRQVAGGLIALSQECLERHRDRSLKTKVEKILLDWQKCSSDSYCIDPDGSSFENHRWDQSILSLLVHNTQLQPSKTYWASWALVSWYKERWFPMQNEGIESIYLFLRRNHCPKPFTSHLIHREFSRCKSLKQSLERNDWSKQLLSRQRNPIACDEQPQNWHLFIFLFIWIVSFFLFVRLIFGTQRLTYFLSIFSFSASRSVGNGNENKVM